MLDKLNINTSKLDNMPLDVSCILTDHNINMNLEKSSNRGRKELIQIPSVGHLKYDRFK